MLLRLQLLHRQRLALLERRQLVRQRLIFFVFRVFRFFVNFQEAVKLQHRPSHAEGIGAITLRFNIDGGLVENSRGHLRGNEPLPDELVNLIFVFL